jgi:rhodanese-related sulfurtransferase/TusA-related sulfurtransferase
MSSDVSLKVNHTLDCKGLACPMPIVRTKKTIDTLQAGEVIEVLATDKGSIADMQGWCKNTGHQFLGFVTEGDILKHYIRKSPAEDLKAEITFAHTITNEQLQDKLDEQASVARKIQLVDVREPAEYAFQHIPGAISVPLGELEASVSQLAQDVDTYVICRTGNRSDMACQTLAAHGFATVYNVIPGMLNWSGPVETL